MAKSVVPIAQGFQAQAIWFWLKAMDLYVGTNVEAVGFEVDDPRGFDDLARYYREPDEGAEKEFYQIKFRVVAGAPFACEALTDPGFINWTSRDQI